MEEKFQIFQNIEQIGSVLISCWFKFIQTIPWNGYCRIIRIREGSVFEEFVGAHAFISCFISLKLNKDLYIVKWVAIKPFSLCCKKFVNHDFFDSWKLNILFYLETIALVSNVARGLEKNWEKETRNAIKTILNFDRYFHHGNFCHWRSEILWCFTGGVCQGLQYSSESDHNYTVHHKLLLPLTE